MFKTQDDLKFSESRLTTPFSELLNSSGIIKKFDMNTSGTMTVKPFELSQANSGLVTVDRRSNSKDRPASVIQKKNNFDFTRKSSSNDSINRHEGRYTPIGKLEILCEDSKRLKEGKFNVSYFLDFRSGKSKLKDIGSSNVKGKSSSISSNNRRGKKSAARIERSKQILSKSCERKSSKSKKNADYK